MWESYVPEVQTIPAATTMPGEAPIADPGQKC